MAFKPVTAGGPEGKGENKANTVGSVPLGYHGYHWLWSSGCVRVISTRCCLVSKELESSERRSFFIPVSVEKSGIPACRWLYIIRNPRMVSACAYSRIRIRTRDWRLLIKLTLRLARTRLSSVGIATPPKQKPEARSGPAGSAKTPKHFPLDRGESH